MEVFLMSLFMLFTSINFFNIILNIRYQNELLHRQLEYYDKLVEIAKREARKNGSNKD